MDHLENVKCVFNTNFPTVYENPYSAPIIFRLGILYCGSKSQV